MFTSKGLLQLHSWTHESFGLVFDHCAGLHFKVLSTAVPGFGYKTLRNQLLHIIETEHYWVWKLQNSDSPDRDYSGWHYGRWGSLLRIREQRDAVAEHTRGYITALGSRELSAPLELRWPDKGRLMQVTPAQVLHHIFTHAYHHKGQAAAMLRLLGHPLGDTDLLRF